MYKFTEWLEHINQTQMYTPNMTQTTHIEVPSTDANADGKTHQSTDDTYSSDPAIIGHVATLKNIHDNLRNIFTDIRNRVAVFRNSKTRAAFEREMIAGIDGIGRSKAILPQ